MPVIQRETGRWPLEPAINLGDGDEGSWEAWSFLNRKLFHITLAPVFDPDGRTFASIDSHEDSPALTGTRRPELQLRAHSHCGMVAFGLTYRPSFSAGYLFSAGFRGVIARSSERLGPVTDLGWS